MPHRDRLKNIADIFRPSELQRTMLNHSLLFGGGEMYVEQICVSVRGSFDPALYHKAWDLLAERHGALRSAFVWEKLDDIRQVVMRSVKIPFSFVDLSDLPPEQRQRRIAEFRDEDAKTGFKLSHPPLVRITVFRLTEHHHVVVDTVHHAIVDGWSFRVLLGELDMIYLALQDGTSPKLPPATGYRAFVQWLDNKDHEAARVFWKSRLARVERPTLLPRSLAPSRQTPRKHRSVHRGIDAETVKRLRQGCRSLRITENTLFLMAWAILLGRYDASSHVTFGSVHSLRPAELPGAEGIVGPLINTVPVGIHIDEDASLADLAAATQKNLAECYAHAHLPLSRILEQHPDYRGSASPLFETIAAFEGFAAIVKPEEYGDSYFESIDIAEHVGYPAAITCTPGETWDLKLLFHTDRLGEEYARQMLDTLAGLLGAIVENPARPAGELYAAHDCWQLDRFEQRLRGPARPLGDTLAQRLHANARQYPDRPAIDDGKTRIDYARLSALISRMAANLRAAPGEIIGVSLPRGAEAFVSLAAVIDAGACYLPLDPSYPAERIRFMVENSGVKRIIATENFACAADVAVLSYDELTRADGIATAAAVQSPAGDDTPAYLIYTSGSTGTPKAAINHRAGLKTLMAACEEWIDRPFETVLQFASLSFDASLLEACLAAVRCGCLRIVPDELRASPQAMQDFLAGSGVTAAFLPPVIVAQLDKAALPALRTLMTGADVCPAEAGTRWAADRRFFNLYGPSEAAVVTLSNAAHDSGMAEALGHPVPNTQVRLLDPKGRPVPPGVVGELWLRGPGVGAGYLFQPEQTARAFVDGGYLTGDLGYADTSGTVHFVGRKDKQVQIRGYRVEPGEIEQTLRALPNVAEAVVLARRNDRDETLLHAFVQPRTDAAGFANTLRRTLKRTLPLYMIPAHITVVVEWPLTPNNKIDRSALQARTVAASADETAEACGTDMERVVAAIFAEVFERNPESIGRNDDFFALGGHSLQATTAVLKLRRKLDAAIPLDMVYNASRVSELAAELERMSGNADPAADDPMAQVRVFARTLPRLPPMPPPSPARTVLLAGATSLLGTNICHALHQRGARRILCLLRGTPGEDALPRLRDSLEEHGLHETAQHAGLEAHFIDPMLPQLGLSEAAWRRLADEIDAIYHNGAWAYGGMLAINASITEKLLRLAMEGKAKTFHYVSSLSVIEAANQPLVDETTPLDQPEALRGGFSRSKWITEQLCHAASAAGLPVALHRIGVVTAHTPAGAAATADRIIPSMVAVCRALGAYPDVPYEAHFTQAAHCAQAIAALEATAPATVSHLTNPEAIRWSDFGACVSRLGQPLERLSTKDWLDRMENMLARAPSDDLRALLTFGRELVHDPGRPARQALADSTRKRLAALDLHAQALGAAEVIERIDRAAAAA